MTKRFKKILFFSICGLFIIVTPIVILYASGYRFDFDNMRIVQTGGLFFKISPPGVMVYMNDEPYKKTSFFFDTALISGLLPKSYQISIQKNDYHSWEKELAVEEKMVTEAKSIVLFPKNPLFNLAFKNIEALFPAPDEKKAVVEIAADKGWSFASFDCQNQKQEQILAESDLQILESDNAPAITQKISGTEPTNIIWSSDSKRILIELDKKGEKQYLATEPSPNKGLFVIDRDNKIKKISFNPNNSEEIFFLSSAPTASAAKTNSASKTAESLSAIFIIRGNGEETALDFSDPSLKQNVLAYAIIDNYLVWLSESGLIYKGTINGDKISLTEILNVRPMTIKASANYQILSKGLSNILLKEDEGLYRLNPEKRLLEKIFDSAKEIIFAKDMKKIAVNAGNQIWLYYLEEEKNQPQRNKEEKLLLYSSPQEITNLYWLNNHYLIFRVNESIKITEIDNRCKPNLLELTTFPNLAIFWLSNKLFVLSNNNLFFSEDVVK
ncbi:hypothetical protein KJ616_01850 [Patescibacteria group bacterium]|nr:hypothetical protein [Patescibacteria group bacterium]